MAPRISPFSPFSLKLNKKRKQTNNKKVSFGKNDKVIKIERIPVEEKAAVWYGPREMSMFQQSRSFKESMKTECSEESYFHAQKHVKQVTNTCRLQLERADGYWHPKMATELSRISLAGSKAHREEALKRAKTIRKEINSQPKPEIPLKKGKKEGSKPRLSTETTLTEMDSILMEALEDSPSQSSRPSLMRTQGMVRLKLPMMIEC